MDWEYFPLTQHSGGKFVDGGDDLYELVIIVSETNVLHLPIILVHLRNNNTNVCLFQT